MKMTSSMITSSPTNVTYPVNKIFLQTAAAQGIAGVFAFSAILVTVHQVFIIIYFYLIN